ncbi:hypothetical protein COCVIDRAFT_112795 [Bipolaris victoriae FI3]|uniref:Uncharacterized protein n=1 Tax=Bipolaris victoriae (strain FI3) TaxID=930091 RepID=W7E0E2_BIPV3|nr:hypothetical protein COCVIDRAFT_112795 [Bipolaris victoriae FI3]
MVSNNQNPSLSEQLALFPPLSAMVAMESSTTFNTQLPPIPEGGWDFNWKEDTFPPLNLHEDFEQTTTATNDNSLPETNEEMIKLQDEVRQLRHDISELNEMVYNRLDDIEKRLSANNRYVGGSLVPWLMEVHDKYSQMLARVTKQEEQAVNRAI